MYTDLRLWYESDAPWPANARAMAPSEGVAVSDYTNPWLDIVGPGYTAASARQAFGLSARELDDALRHVRVLVLETENGVTLHSR